MNLWQAARCKKINLAYKFTISSKSINNSLVNYLPIALAKKFKRTEHELFYISFQTNKWATHIKTFMAIRFISIKALGLLLKDSFFDPQSFGFPLLFPVRVERLFINWSVGFFPQFLTRLGDFLLTYIRSYL